MLPVTMLKKGLSTDFFLPGMGYATDLLKDVANDILSSVLNDEEAENTVKSSNIEEELYEEVANATENKGEALTPSEFRELRADNTPYENIWLTTEENVYTTRLYKDTEFTDRTPVDDVLEFLHTTVGKLEINGSQKDALKASDKAISLMIEDAESTEEQIQRTLSNTRENTNTILDITLALIQDDESFIDEALKSLLDIVSVANKAIQIIDRAHSVGKIELIAGLYHENGILGVIEGNPDLVQ